LNSPSPVLGSSDATRNPLGKIFGALIEEVRFAADSPLEGAGFEPSVPGRLQAKTPRFGIVLRRLLSSCGSFHIDHRLSCHVRNPAGSRSAKKRMSPRRCSRVAGRTGCR
jgi:hypothetical protein